jgi:radical SAM superfamily enzyme YgiQ (UPF0313 family)
MMEPLAIGQLSALTPAGWEKKFYDDRLEAIRYDEPTDLVALSVETYTARRAYQISDRFRQRGVPVVMGGFHPTLAPEDAAQHADAIVVGEAEGVWSRVLEDFLCLQLQSRYEAERRPGMAGVFPDRTIFAGKRYIDLALVETGRGCRQRCDFCSISAFFNRTFNPRPVEDVVREIASMNRKRFFFVDDNIAVERERALALFKALAPLGITWFGQVSALIAEDEELLKAMRQSGCMGVLVGFESLSPASIAVAAKGLRGTPRKAYEQALDQFARNRIAIYGTFVFGYDVDTEKAVEESVAFALKHRLFCAAFNHLVPFPGTPLHRRLVDERRLARDDWWLDPDYRFGDLAFRPARLTAPELSEACYRARRAFYAWPQILKRAMNRRSNCQNFVMTSFFLATNLLSKREVDRRQGLPLGCEK